MKWIWVLLVSSISLSSQTLTTLFSFNKADGSSPSALVQALAATYTARRSTAEPPQAAIVVAARHQSRHTLQARKPAVPKTKLQSC
jgi:hypothetical protein